MFGTASKARFQGYMWIPAYSKRKMLPGSLLEVIVHLKHFERYWHQLLKGEWGIWEDVENENQDNDEEGMSVELNSRIEQ